MQMRSEWLGKIAIVLWVMLGAWQAAFADTVQGDILVGDQNRAQRVAIPLSAGSYRLHLLDPFATEHFALTSAGVLLALGIDPLAQLSISAGGNAAAADFQLANASELELFVHAAAGQSTGAAVVAVESMAGPNAGQRVFEQAFSFSEELADSDHYEFHDTVKVAEDSSVLFDLTDMHAISLSFAPFESIVVRVANTTATEVLDTWCWYLGVVSTADAASCENMNGVDGQTISQTLAVRQGFVSWYVAAKAPLAQTSQLGWSLFDDTAGRNLGEDVVIVNRSGNNYAREVGRFTLAARTTVDVDLNVLSDVVSPFKLAIVSAASGNAIRLDNSAPQQTGISLNAGEYRILLSDDLSGDEGLLGIRISDGTAQVFGEVFSLGNFQRLGEVESTTAGSTPVTLSLYELRHPIDVRIANGAEVVLRLTDTEQTGNFIREPGHYSLWGRFDADAEDDLYQVQIGSGASKLGEFLAATGTRLIEQRKVELSTAVSASMAVRNFEFPDALGERFRMMLIQEDGAPLTFDVGSDHGESVQEEVNLAAGVAYIALFASQDVPGSATVIGYQFEYDSVSGGNPSNPAPPRSNNGSGGKSGGGSAGSFLLYALLVFKCLRQRIIAANGRR